MRQQIETTHALEVRHQGGVFHPAAAGMYQEARKLADEGMLQQALEKANDLHIENYGHMRGTEFRITTTIKMVTALGPWESFSAP